jgi:hypothetical protein
LLNFHNYCRIGIVDQCWNFTCTVALLIQGIVCQCLPFLINGSKTKTLIVKLIVLVTRRLHSNDYSSIFSWCPLTNLYSWVWKIKLNYKILKYALDTKVTKVIQPFHAMLIWLNSPFKASVSHWTLYAYRHTFTILSLAKIPPQSFKSA